MTPEDPNQFDDPALKAALRRAVGPGGAAPLELRRKIEAMFAPQLAPPHRSSMSRLWSLPAVKYGLTAAAIVVIAVGTSVLLSSNAINHLFSPSPPPHVAAGLSTTLISGMVATHDHCSAQPDHHLLPGVKDDFTAIAKVLQTQLNQPVIARQLGEPGWTFKGAGVCNVGPYRSGHLLFARGDERVSIFSLASSCIECTTEGADYQLTEQKHPVAGFVRGGGFFCVVGYGADGNLTQPDVIKLRDELQTPATASACDRLMHVVAQAR